MMSFRGIIWLMAALLLCFAPVTAAAGETVPAAPDPKTAPCKGLKPYNNLDELLYQFYINLDSDCLFKLPIEKLENIWDTKILYKERTTSVAEYNSLHTGPDFLKKPYDSHKNAFFMRSYYNHMADLNGLEIALTIDYFTKYATIFNHQRKTP